MIARIAAAVLGHLIGALAAAALLVGLVRCAA